MPIAARHIPKETATADPLEDPPEMRDVSQGFFTTPKCGFAPVTPKAISCKLVFPKSTLPDCLSFVTTVASSPGSFSLKNFEPAVVGTPAIFIKSFRPRGMPSKGRSPWPIERLLYRTSACMADCTAISGTGLMKTGKSALRRAI